MGKYKRNIGYNYLYYLLAINFTHGFWMIYLFEKGYSLTQLGILETIFHMTSFTMEVPTGIVADVFGRKTSRVMGRIIHGLSLLLVFFAGSFLELAIAFILTAISYNLESGAGDALIYDSLKVEGEESSYLKIAGRNEFMLQIGFLIAFLGGGLIASRSYEVLYILSIAASFVAAAYSFIFFREPPYKADENKGKLREFIDINKKGMKLMTQNRDITRTLLSIEVFFATSTVLFFYFQNYWKSIGYSESYIGFFFAITAFLGSFGGLLTHRIDKFLGLGRIMRYMPLLMLAGMLFISLDISRVVFFVVLGVAESILYVALNDYINKNIDSDIRATVLSISSMVFSLYMMLLFPVFGYIADNHGFRAAFFTLLILNGILTIVNMKKHPIS